MSLSVSANDLLNKLPDIKRALPHSQIQQAARELGMDVDDGRAMPLADFFQGIGIALALRVNDQDETVVKSARKPQFFVHRVCESMRHMSSPASVGPSMAP